MHPRRLSVRLPIAAWVLLAAAAATGGHATEHLHPPVDDNEYIAHCGLCHPAYAPEWLPEVAWRRILDTLDDHFGEWVELAAGQRRPVERFLGRRAADRSDSPLSVRIRDLRRSGLPRRVTGTGFFAAAHRDVPRPADSAAGESLARCGACHVDVERGNYGVPTDR